MHNQGQSPTNVYAWEITGDYAEVWEIYMAYSERCASDPENEDYRAIMCRCEEFLAEAGIL